jgi:hypothetical protein
MNGVARRNCPSSAKSERDEPGSVVRSWPQQKSAVPDGHGRAGGVRSYRRCPRVAASKRKGNALLQRHEGARVANGRNRRIAPARSQEAARFGRSTRDRLGIAPAKVRQRTIRPRQCDAWLAQAGVRCLKSGVARPAASSPWRFGKGDELRHWRLSEFLRVFLTRSNEKGPRRRAHFVVPVRRR